MTTTATDPKATPDHIDLPIGSPRVLRAAELAARGGLKLALVPYPHPANPGDYRSIVSTTERYRHLLDRAGVDVEIIRRANLPDWRAQVGRRAIAVVVMPVRAREISRYPSRLTLTPTPRLENALFTTEAAVLLSRAIGKLDLDLQEVGSAATVAWTAAEIAGKPRVGVEHVAEALSFRDPTVRTAA